MRIKKILVIGGTHGDERTGVQVVQSLQKQNILHIRAVIANERAAKKRTRYVETDLNRSAGKTLPVSYEERRSQELGRDIAKSDLVLEFHNARSADCTCAIVTTQKPNQLHYALARHFGVSRILVMPPAGSLSSLASPKFFSLEISKQDKAFGKISTICARIVALSNNAIANQGGKKPRLYQYTNTAVALATLKRLGLKCQQFRNFQILSQGLCKRLGLPVSRKFVPFFVQHGQYPSEPAFYIAEI